MRTFLAGITMFALAVPGTAANRNFGITDYTRVRVEGPYKVTLATGVAPFAKATGSPTGLDRVAIEVRGDTLVVRTDPSAWGGYPGAEPGPVEVMLGTHDLSQASLAGAGSLEINHVKGLSFGLSVQGSGAARIDEVAADQLNVSLSGSGSIALSGRAKRLTAAVHGLAALDAAKLTTPDAHITAEGAATVDAAVVEAAEVDASGPTTIRFTGKPACVLRVTGSATVSGCK